ncbi:rhomboid family intramembrane serine protease [Octadecabacter sp. 1_MG-2023]|uniref:rhomboid family intramembrane serine protease n=1 Tax=unclassified Octadecabacter TaxID=196158 RepID=UPI001C0963E5|nr:MULTISPECIES: rhomboid family intramembrane serine protease [unclassified Octadecabacter]MBU2992670.1 rhomboid family intramembrane serine protease [Octadecabacter sp. B2R22]MDO6733879.1 rhomboid family intramembrane serine protease [Octadecabacter sp. 1_MG-2023]
MLPIRDHNPSERTPYVTYALIAINIAVFAWQYGVLTNVSSSNQFLIDYAFWPVLFESGDGYTGMFTHMFLHGGLMHIAGNMLFLWIFGDNMEEEFGHVPFLIFYIASGLAAAYLQYLPNTGSQIPMVGASGAIAGVMGGYLLLFPKARVDIFFFFVIFFRIFSLPSFVVLGVWMALQVFNGLGSDLNGGGTAYWAHVGGFIAGMVITIPIWLRRGATKYWDRTHGHPPHPETHYPTSNVPIVRRNR